jgi:ferric-dicitrate binding protein FerR (iron transport regulator)
LDLGNLARLKLYAESTLTVEFSRSTLLGSLNQGSLHSFVPAGVRADIVAARASIVSDPVQPAAFSIQVDAGNATISVETGRVEVRAGNRVRTVSAGERFSTAADAQPLPEPQQNVNKRKLIWLFLGIGAAVAVLVVAITGRDNEPPCDGGAVVLSPTAGGPGICQ